MKNKLKQYLKNIFKPRPTRWDNFNTSSEFEALSGHIYTKEVSKLDKKQFDVWEYEGVGNGKRTETKGILKPTTFSYNTNCAIYVNHYRQMAKIECDGSTWLIDYNAFIRDRMIVCTKEIYQ